MNCIDFLIDNLNLTNFALANLWINYIKNFLLQQVDLLKVYVYFCSDTLALSFSILAFLKLTSTSYIGLASISALFGSKYFNISLI